MRGLGVNQSIDAAGMDPYVNYEHRNIDARTAIGATFGAGGGLEDFQPVIAGGIIRFWSDSEADKFEPADLSFLGHGIVLNRLLGVIRRIAGGA